MDISSYAWFPFFKLVKESPDIWVLKSTKSTVHILRLALRMATPCVKILDKLGADPTLMQPLLTG
jgi:hypothetical protein